MKKIYVLLVVTFLVSFSIPAHGQASHNPAYIGEIYVDVNLSTDPTERGYATYPVPAPNNEPYGWVHLGNSQTRVTCYGPGNPYITQFTEDAPMLHIRLSEIKLFLEDSAGHPFAYIEAPILQTIPNLGISGTEPVQCFYYIVLVIKP